MTFRNCFIGMAVLGLLAFAVVGVAFWPDISHHLPVAGTIMAALGGTLALSVNQTNLRGVHLTLPVPIGANAGVGPNSGDPLVFGRGTSPSFGLAGVAETSYTPPTGTPTGSISVNFEGIFNLTVTANNGTISPGDRVYAQGGTYDPVTGCLYGFTLTNTATLGEYFGNVMTTILSGVTAVALVRLKVSG